MQKKKNRFARLFLAAGLSLLLSSGLLYTSGCSRGAGDSTGSGGEPVIPSVEAVKARHGALPLTQRLSGVVRAKNQVQIYPRISAIVTEVLVEDGDAVREGDPLVRLQDVEYRQQLRQAEASHRIAAAQLRQAEARLKEARAELERLRALADQELTSPAELETAETLAESAEADVDLAKARIEQADATAEEERENLSQTVIRAPITGHVGNRDAEVGMLVSPSTRLFTLGQLDSVRVEVVLTDRMLAYIEEGQRAEVSTAGSALSARLSRISPFLHPVAHSTEAEIDMANEDGLFKPGMFVTVDIFYGESEEATLVPLSALYDHPETGVIGVYVTDASLDQRPSGEAGDAEAMPLTEPVPFEFVPARVIAEGRMEAAVGGVEPETWVMTIGQNLLGGETAEARVRPVDWERVERLQRLQRDDLMRDMIEPRTSR